MTAAFTPYEGADARSARRLLKIGKRVGIVGLALLLVGGALLGTGLFRVFSGLSKTRDRLDVEVVVPGTSELHLESGTYEVVAIGQGLIRRVGSSRRDHERRTLTAFAEPTVSIKDSDGIPAPYSAPRSSFSYSNNGYDLVSMGSFRVDTADTYRIEVEGEPGQVESIGVGPADDSNGGVLALGGGALLALGVPVSIVGLGVFVAGRVRRNRHLARMGSMPAWAPVPGPPGHATVPHGRAPSGGWSPPPPPPPSPYPPAGPTG